jgi:hypothetical protein
MGWQPQGGLAERLRRGVPTSGPAILGAIARQAELGADEFILLSCQEELATLDALIDVVGPAVQAGPTTDGD